MHIPMSAYVNGNALSLERKRYQKQMDDIAKRAEVFFNRPVSGKAILSAIRKLRK